jgi:hypothetical protein
VFLSYPVALTSGYRFSAITNSPVISGHVDSGSSDVTSIDKTVSPKAVSDMINALADTNGLITSAIASNIAASVQSNANRNPYIIAAGTGMVVSAANGDIQLVRGSYSGGVTNRLTFPAADTNYSTTISLTIPPTGTNTVVLTAGPYYEYDSVLGTLRAPSTTNLTRFLYEATAGYTNPVVYVWEGGKAQ